MMNDPDRKEQIWSVVVLLMFLTTLAVVTFGGCKPIRVVGPNCVVVEVQEPSDTVVKLECTTP